MNPHHQSDYLKLTPQWNSSTVSARVKITLRNNQGTHGTSRYNPYIHKTQITERSLHDIPTDPFIYKNDHEAPITQAWQGHPRSGQRNNDPFTICFSNLNGIIKGPERSLTANLKDLSTSLQYHKISLLGLCEHHLPLNNPGMAEKLHQFE